jgi:hypothetical protein
MRTGPHAGGRQVLLWLLNYVPMDSKIEKTSLAVIVVVIGLLQSFGVLGSLHACAFGSAGLRPVSSAGSRGHGCPAVRSRYRLKRRSCPAVAIEEALRHWGVM